MIVRLGIGSLSLIVVLLPVASATEKNLTQELKSQSALPTESAVRAKLSGLEVPFIANEGQIDSRVAFFAHTFAGSVFVTRTGEMVYSLPRATKDAPATSRPSAGRAALARDARPGWTLVERFAGGTAIPTAGAPHATNVSTFLGNDPSRWRAHVPTTASVELGKVWPGIAVSLAAHGRNVEKIYRLGAGVSADAIRMDVDGATSLRLADDGALVASTDLGEVRFGAPVAYQEREADRVAVEVAYRVLGSSYGFQLGAHDPRYPVVIDPLLQSTYLGGGDQDRAEAIVVTSNAVYVAGDTFSTNFPGTAGGAQPNPGATGPDSDAYVAQFNLALTSLVQTTYLGGNGPEVATSLLVIGNEVFVAGDTFSTNFPGTAGGAQPIPGGGSLEGFVARLNLGLTTLNQATYLGGNSVDRIRSMQRSGSELFVVGHTASTNFPAAAGGAQPTFAGGGLDGDGYVARLNLALTSVNQSTYLGGGASDAASSLSLTASEVFVAGYTGSSNFPGTAGGAQPGNGGGSDGFVARLNLALTTLNQATYLGGGNSDVAYPVLVDGSDVFVAGYTSSTNFPGTAGGAQPSNGGGQNDAFVARLNLGLTTLNQSTYLGGNDADFIDPETPKAMFVIGSELFVANTTLSTNFPGTAGGMQPNHGGGLYDAYVARFDRTLTALNQATYIGGNALDVSGAFFVSGTDVFVTGTTASPNFPGIAGGAQTNLGGGSNDSFVTRLTYDLGQCGLRDNLDGGPCCTATSVVLPTFPSTTDRTKYICFQNCGTRINRDACVSIGAPVPVQVAGNDVCGVFVVPYSIQTCGANPRVLWTGNLRAHYSRNWMASSVAGTAPDTEVWRFLLNGDLIPSAFLLQRYGGNPAAVPPCRAAFGNRVHFWGYIDYARHCRSQAFSTAWVLNHDCDAFEHGATSARPGAFHPGHSYDFVGPASGFVPDPSTPPLSFGQIVREAIRKNDWAAVPAICLFEEPAQGVMDFGIPSCPCVAGTPVGSQFLTVFLQGQGSCGSTFALATNSPIPLVRKRIGRWTNGAAYPGLESLFLQQGFLTINDACGSPPDQFFKGVETMGGFSAFHFAPGLTPLDAQFLDLGSANRSPGNVSPIVGAPHVTHYILNLNSQ